MATRILSSLSNSQFSVSCRTEEGLELLDGLPQLAAQPAAVPLQEDAAVLRQSDRLGPQVPEQPAEQREGVQQVILAGGLKRRVQCRAAGRQCAPPA